MDCTAIYTGTNGKNYPNPPRFRKIARVQIKGTAEGKSFTLTSQLTPNGVRVDCYQPAQRSSLPAIVMYTGLMVKPLPFRRLQADLFDDLDGRLRFSNYLGSFPLELALFLGVPVIVAYEPGVSGRHKKNGYRRHSAEDAARQITEGLIAAVQAGLHQHGVVPMSHSLATAAHLEMIFTNKYQKSQAQANVQGGVVACPLPRKIERALEHAPGGSRLWAFLFNLAKKVFPSLALPVNPLFFPYLHVLSKKRCWQHGLGLMINARRTAKFTFDEVNIGKLIEQGFKDVTLHTVENAGHNFFVLEQEQRYALYGSIRQYLERLGENPEQLMVLGPDHDLICPPKETQIIALQMAN